MSLDRAAVPVHKTLIGVEGITCELCEVKFAVEVGLVAVLLDASQEPRRLRVDEQADNEEPVSRDCPCLIEEGERSRMRPGQGQVLSESNFLPYAKQF